MCSWSVASPKTSVSEEEWDVTPGLSEPVEQAVGEAVALIQSLIADARNTISAPGAIIHWPAYPERSVAMKFLETLAGAVLARVPVFILLVGMLFTVGSMGKYLRNKAM